MSGQYLLTTLGCKVNQYESQQVREVLESYGLRPLGRTGSATVAVVNTCAVTGNASRKNRQAIRRASASGCTPVIVVGCGATADAVQLRSLPGVVAVLGHETDVCTELRAILIDHFGLKPQPKRDALADTDAAFYPQPVATRNEVRIMADVPMASRQRTASLNSSAVDRTLELPIVKTEGSILARIESFCGHQRAFLKVQDGCDAHCTYCIIPRLRPRLRSKPIEIAVAEAEGLVRAGHKEIILTGIFLGAYGRETALRKRWAAGRSPLAELVAALADVEGLVRLRLSSLEPGDMDDDLLDVVATRDTCVPHFHLPLQSGSDEVLRRMNRQYTRGQFTEMIDRVRAALDRPAITTDIIVGFPGETNADFEASMELARYAQVCKIHAFPFSPRDKTAAARWQSEFVKPPIVKERMKRLADLERELSLSFRRQFIGEAEHVIVESHGGLRHTLANESATSDVPSTEETIDAVAILDDRTIVHGRADRYFEIHFESDDLNPGDLATVRIDRVTPTRTHGTRVDRARSPYPLHVLSAT